MHSSLINHKQGVVHMRKMQQQEREELTVKKNMLNDT